MPTDDELVCTDGGDHFEHIWLYDERHWHVAMEGCWCSPELLCDEDGFYYLHHERKA